MRKEGRGGGGGGGDGGDGEVGRVGVGVGSFGGQRHTRIPPAVALKHFQADASLARPCVRPRFIPTARLLDAQGLRALGTVYVHLSLPPPPPPPALPYLPPLLLRTSALASTITSLAVCLFGLVLLTLPPTSVVV